MDLFASRSKDWDKLQRRVNVAKKTADIICSSINLNKKETVIDFGAGTGLLSSFLDTKVKKIIGVDKSLAMLDEFSKKNFACEQEVLKLDIDNNDFPQNLQVDGIISTMTLHHIKDIKLLFKKFYKILKNKGFIALTDLEKEDGTFHKNNEGVYHFGFEKEKLRLIAQKSGFLNISFFDVFTVIKPHKDFKLFCMVAFKGNL